MLFGVNERPGKAAGKQRQAQRESHEDEKRGEFWHNQHGGHRPVKTSLE